MIHPRDFDGKVHGDRFRARKLGADSVEYFSLKGAARIQKRRFAGELALAVQVKRKQSRHTSWLRLDGYSDLQEGWR